MFRTALFAALVLAGSVAAGPITHTMTIRNGCHVEQRTFVWCHGSWHDYHGPRQTCRDARCDGVVQCSTADCVPQPRYYQRQAPWQAPRVPNADGTFPYDGGPRNPVPMLPPQQAPEDARTTLMPDDSLQPGETFVSVSSNQSEKKPGKWNFPAYGEKPTRNEK